MTDWDAIISIALRIFAVQFGLPLYPVTVKFAGVASLAGADAGAGSTPAGPAGDETAREPGIHGSPAPKIERQAVLVGYGVKLGKGQNLMSVVAFYHKAPPTKDVMARFTMYVAPKGTKVQEMDVYQVGVNIVCYSKFGQRGADQTDEGIEIKPGVSVLSAPLKFNMDGCVKFAYPHGHDELLMVALENKSSRETLLRTVPEVGADGTFRDFRPHQVYRDDKGFTVTKRDDYEMVMVHHHPLQNPNIQHGMGNYLLYMTPGVCPQSADTASAR